MRRHNARDIAPKTPGVGSAEHRELNKSSSAPPQGTRSSWLARIGKFLKSISALDSTSRDSAIASENAQGGQQTLPQVHAVEGHQHHKRMQHTTPASREALPSILSPATQHGRTLGAMGGQPVRRGMLETISSNFKRLLHGMGKAQHHDDVMRMTTDTYSHATTSGGLHPKQSLSSGDSHDIAAHLQAVRSRARGSPYSRVRRRSNIMAMSAELPAGMDREVWCIEDYTNVTELHKGYASEVYRAVCRISGSTVVLKVYHPECLHEISRYQLMREARLHAQLSHHHIIKQYAAFKQGDGVVLVLEYADGEDLLKLLQRTVRLSERTTVHLVVQPLLKALHYLHSKSIVHRDIKLENVLFDGPDMTLKLADFGLCLNLKEERSVTRAGTLDYMAPEVLKCPTKNMPGDNKDRGDLAYNCAVDVWAVGVVAYELLNGMPPFSRMDRLETENLILQGWKPPFMVHASDLAKDFIYNCLKRTSQTRPSAWQLLKHPWITSAQRPPSSQVYSSFEKKAAVGQHGGASTSALAARLHAGSQLRQPAASEQLPSSDHHQAGIYEDTGTSSEGLLPNAVPEIQEAGSRRPNMHQEQGYWLVPSTSQTSPKPTYLDPVRPSGGRAAVGAAMRLKHLQARSPRLLDLAAAASGSPLRGQAAPAPASPASSAWAAGGSHRAAPGSLAAQSRGVAQELHMQQKFKVDNSVRDEYLETVTQVDVEAAERRAGRMLLRQQALGNTTWPARARFREIERLSTPTRQRAVDQALLNAMPHPKPRLERAFSELSRHTTDTGYRSATRSRRNSQALDDDDSGAEEDNPVV